jgi:hypothetical protein
MPSPEWLAEQFEQHRAHLGGGVSDARVGERGRRCSPGKLDSTRPDRCQRRSEPARLADDRRLARVFGHPADADITAGGCPEYLCARSRDHSRRPDPESDVVLADSVGLALLVVLETLEPADDSRSCCMTCSARH